MIRVTIRFYGDLKELIYKNYEGTTFQRSLPGPTSVKDLIEGCGVPHTEIDLILVDGESVGFSYLVQGGEQISVYPFFTAIDLPDGDRLQKPTLSDPRFLVDVNLGKLARYLRLAGFNTAYHRKISDDELIDQMLEEDRTLLSRDRKLLMRKVVTCGYLPRSDQAEKQLEEVLRRFDLFDKVAPYSRCVHCNDKLQSVSKEEVVDLLEPLTKRHFDTFSQCPNCEKVYWAGSHRKRLNPKLKEIFGDRYIRHDM